MLLAHNDFVVMQDKLSTLIDQDKADAGRFNFIVGVDSASVADDSLIVIERKGQWIGSVCQAHCCRHSGKTQRYLSNKPQHSVL